MLMQLKYREFCTKEFHLYIHIYILILLSHFWRAHSLTECDVPKKQQEKKKVRMCDIATF